MADKVLPVRIDFQPVKLEERKVLFISVYDTLGNRKIHTHSNKKSNLITNQHNNRFVNSKINKEKKNNIQTITTINKKWRL